MTPHAPLDLSLVVACYNEEPILENSVRETLRVLDGTRLEYEVIFVDDCSRDRTREIIDRLIARDAGHRLRKIEHAVNVGRGGTVTDGLRSATGRVAGFLDIDLEVHAQHIPTCVQAIDDGWDVATGLRVYTFRWRSVDRYLMSKGYARLMRWALGLPFRDTETGFKFFRRNAILPVLDRVADRGWFWDTEIMARAYQAGLRIIEVPVLFERRFDKESSVSTVRDTLDYLRKLWRFRATLRHERRHLRQPAPVPTIPEPAARGDRPAERPAAPIERR